MKRTQVYKIYYFLRNDTEGILYTDHFNTVVGLNRFLASYSDSIEVYKIEQVIIPAERRTA